MMMAYNIGDIRELLHAAYDLRPFDRMLLDGLPFRLIQTAWFIEDIVWRSDLPDIMDLGGKFEVTQFFFRKAHRLGNGKRQLRDPARVFGRIRLFGINRSGQRLDRGEHNGMVMLLVT